MAKINEIDEAGPVTGDETLLGVQDGMARQLPVLDLFSAPGAADAIKVGDRSLSSALDSLDQRSDVVISTGRDGDAPDILSAISGTSRYRPTFVNKGVNLEARLKSGEKIGAPVFVVQNDLSHGKITHEDWLSHGITGKINRAGINQNNGNASTNNWRTGTYPVLTAMRNGASPFLASRFEFDDSGAVTANGNPAGAGGVGAYAFEGGRLVVARGAGIEGAGWRGLYVDGGYAYARSTTWRRSGLVGGPDTASFVAAGGYGIRVSNMGTCMGRGADVSESAIGAYVSNGFASFNDLKALNCVGLGVGVTDHGYASLSGASANGSGSGFRIDQGADTYGGESSEVAGQYPSATVAGYALVVLGGSKSAFEQPTLSSTTTNAALVRDSYLRIHGGSATTTASTVALKADRGATVCLSSMTVSAPDTETYDIEIAGGSRVILSGLVVREDGVTPSRCNVRGGEFNPNGVVDGRDDRRQIRATDASIQLYAHSAPEQIATANFTQGRTYTLPNSTGIEWKRFNIAHCGTGSPVNVYNPGLTTRLASLRPGESVDVAPNMNGGWFVRSRVRLTASRGLANTTLTLTPSTGEYLYSTAEITVDRVITLYDPALGDARVHKFSRTDTGVGVWHIVGHDGVTPVASVAAGQWVEIVPKADATGWVVTSKGTLA